MALLGAMQLVLGAGLCLVGWKCRLAGVCIVAATGWLAQLDGGLRRITQGDFCWCVTGLRVGASFL